MNWVGLFAALLVIQAGAAPRQQQPQPQLQQSQQTRPQDRGSITGYIVKMGAGDPVSKSAVTISAFNSGRNQSYTATTTANGQFSFQNLEPGQYRLSATRNG